MSDFEEYTDLPVDFSTFLANRMELKKSVDSKSSFDPYQSMLNKKKLESGEYVEPIETPKWPEKDISTLRDFCKQNGIVGFNCGKMSPIAALAFLKDKLGIVDGTLENRIPYGYNKIESSNNKQPSILHG